MAKKKTARKAKAAARRPSAARAATRRVATKAGRRATAGKRVSKKKAPASAGRPARKSAAARSTSRRAAARPAAGPRQSWLDDTAQAPIIEQYARELSTFIDAMADGRIDASELQAQEARLVALMKEVEPELDDYLHEKVTRLLCEITAYDIMHMLHAMAESGQQRRFEG